MIPHNRFIYFPRVWGYAAGGIQRVQASAQTLFGNETELNVHTSVWSN